MLLPLLFALLPLCLWLGVAAQTTGVYLVAIVPAVIYVTCGRVQKREALVFLKMGALLLGLFLLFPLANLLNLGRDPHAILASAARVKPVSAILGGLLEANSPAVAKVVQTVQPGEFIGWKALLQSRLSSSVFGSALIMMAIGLWALVQDRVKAKSRSPSSNVFCASWTGCRVSAESLLWIFLFGCAVSSLFLAVYMGIQTVTGFDPRSPGGILAIEHKQDNGLYRLFGLYGHPLSVAGVALFWTVLSGWMMGKWISEKLFARGLPLSWLGWSDVNWSRRVVPVALSAIAVLHFAFVVLSGGRTALLSAFVMAVVLAFWMRVPTNLRRIRLMALLTSIPLAAVLLFASGALARFQLAVGKVQRGEVVDDRLFFWKVHWRMFLDAPWVGNGHAWMEAWVRRAYYFGMDYERLALKKNFNAHCLYLEILSDVGLMGTFLASLFLIGIFLVLRRAVTQLRAARLLFVAVASGFFANALHGLTENTFFVSNIALVYLMALWVLLWLIVAGSEQAIDAAQS